MKLRLLQLWDRFFFSRTDARVYAGIRISLGCVLLCYLTVLLPDWLKWFGEEGVNTRLSAKANIDSGTWSVFQWLPGSSTVLGCCFGIILLQTLAFLAGWMTRIHTICLWLWLVSLHHRNNLIWEGGDVLLRVALFLAIFMPLGAAWSLDSRKNSQSATVSIWPLRLLQIQQSLLYLSTLGEKCKGSDWISGYALHWVSQLQDFSGSLVTIPFHRFPLPVIQVSTWMTLAIEALLIWGVWVPTIRKQVVLLGILFHLALEVSMNLFAFQWLMIGILLTHLAPVTKEPRLEQRH